MPIKRIRSNAKGEQVSCHGLDRTAMRYDRGLRSCRREASARRGSRFASAARPSQRPAAQMLLQSIPVADSQGRIRRVAHKADSPVRPLVTYFVGQVVDQMNVAMSARDVVREIVEECLDTMERMNGVFSEAEERPGAEAISSDISPMAAAEACRRRRARQRDCGRCSGPRSVADFPRRRTPLGGP